MEGKQISRMRRLHAHPLGTSYRAGLQLSSKLASKGIINVPETSCIGNQGHGGSLAAGKDLSFTAASLLP